jgi:hypothetical protein
MRLYFLPFLILAGLMLFPLDSFSQDIVNNKESVISVLDSLAKKGIISRHAQQRQTIVLSKDQALRYLQETYKGDNWNNTMDPLRQAIGQLIWHASNHPYDSTRSYLERYSYDSISIPWEEFFVWDTLKIKIPVITPLHFKPLSDSLAAADTSIKKDQTDTIKLQLENNLPGYRSESEKPSISLKDTTLLVIVDTLDAVVSSRVDFPFKYYYYPYKEDSIQSAIRSLIGYMDERDSSVVNLTGTSNLKTPVWINSKSDRLIRYWLRNEFSDSVTIWIGSVSKNTLGLYLEEGIIFRRPTKQSTISEAHLNLNNINSARLQDVSKVYVKPKYWKFRSEASFVLNQASLTNWVKGGESSISTSMDITGYADYDNKQMKLLSNNFARLKYGLVASGHEGIKKNLDLLETNSKLNHKAFGKFDFSAVMLFKTQIAKGYNYPNDSVPVSKFLNPAILTIGFGLDYKPNKTTSISFAPLSYKGTFVPDTARIDQTKYGIPKHRRSMHEPGISLLISNEYRPYKTITVTNRLQLFTNYINNPQNIDIDWEMIATININWFTDVRFNTHLIFDDDTKTPVVDKSGKPVIGSDGNQKKTARVQFKEILGFSFVFRF